ncbi:DUF1963 domain-containing protein [Promicromonospora thailandica]|uniref:DUF1963 domain-containing protein n=1 Tax=Promicromonospora thailandica TaxID=765201 RepID=A0A9X2JZ07_9MICO|nr:DUF1963 domain-containing protein [Promicromonospora thailandica]MCP2265594.1 protein of unknown function (DUF1963) [Promicromonospora thailandica]
MHTFEGERAGQDVADGAMPGWPDAVRDCLAPLKVSEVYDAVVDHVLQAAGPEVLDLLRDRPRGAQVVAEPGGYHPPDLAEAVAAAHPGWTRRSADAARRTVYRSAPADVLARLGQVTHAASGRAADGGEPSWLLVLTDDVVRLSRSTDAPGASDVRQRWTADLVEEVAVAGGVPAGSAARFTLSALLYVEPGRSMRGRDVLLDGDAGAAFLARHADVLADVVTGLPFFARRDAAVRCAHSPQAHVDLLGRLAVDVDGGVRAQALTALSGLDGARQVEVLRPHLRTAPADRLPDAVARLTDLDGGVEAVEETLTGTGVDAEAPDPDRERLLRRAVVRVRELRPAGGVVGPTTAAVAVPPVAPPSDPDLARELDALVALPPGSGRDADRAWQAAGDRLSALPDVRALRDARRAAGASDADRWTAELLVTRIGHGGRKIGALLTPADAERWWPLFAERLDLADEYLDGPDGKRHPDEDAVDATAMILMVLERFPAAPEPLVPRLTALALGASRHRLAARRVLRDHPVALTAARAAWAGEDATARSSAAEWLAGLGEPGVAAPAPGWEFGGDALPAAIRQLPADALGVLDRFREQALDEGVPADDVDRWLGLARPALRTAPGGDGPVVGRLGTPLLLPPDAPTPAAGYGPVRSGDQQLVVTLDLATLPPGATDLPLPPDGHLLLFANVELEDELVAGGAVHVPAGTPVEERVVAPDYEPYGYASPAALDEALRRSGDLRLVPAVSLPTCSLDPEADDEHPFAETLQEIWSDLTEDGGEWQVGGHADDFDGYGDPARRSADHGSGEHDTRPEDWVLLAQWYGVPMGLLYWTITRQDLRERRFDRVVVQMYANP